jgi:ppGpp synthetase/RelA/SpoT-type nucleotidyltranferase
LRIDPNCAVFKKCLAIKINIPMTLLKDGLIMAKKKPSRQKKDSTKRSSSIVTKYKLKRDLYRSFSSTCENLIQHLCSSVDGIQISFREKDPDELYKKICRPDHSEIQTLEDIKDLAGVRVICRTFNDVEKIVAILKKELNIQEVKVNPSDLSTSEFGYRSYHLIAKLTKARYSLKEYSAFKDLKVEIQVRTILQHAWAEIEHGPGYKGSATLPNEYKRRWSAIAATLEILDREFAALSEAEGKLNKTYEEAIGQSQWDGMDLNTLSLAHYLKNRYGERPMWFGEPGKPSFEIKPEVIQDDVIDYLTSAGFLTIDQLDAILDLEIVSDMEATKEKITGRLPNIGSILVDIAEFLGGTCETPWLYEDEVENKIKEDFKKRWHYLNIEIPKPKTPN